METVYRDYSPKNVKFYYIYKALAHPETNGYVTPFTQEERLGHVKEAERRLGSGIPWLCDTMANHVKHSFGDAPNSEFIVDPQGVLVKRRAWSDPAQLRRDLEQFVGPVEHVTQVAELNLKTVPPPKAAATGVVPRLKLNGRFNPVKVTPLESGQPFYVKLRAEADEGLLRTGTGNLYLGFLLDPLYHVHWNNLSAPLRFEVTAIPGIKMSPAAGAGPEVKAAADIDPREFLVAVESEVKLAEPLHIEAKFFACNDDEGWCKPVAQQYVVQLEVDRDGGRVQSRGGPASRQKGAGRSPARQLPADSDTQLAGVISRVDTAARSITIRNRNGDDKTVVVDHQTTVMRNGRAGHFDDLKEQDRIIVELKKPTDGSSPLVVTRLRAKES